MDTERNVRCAMLILVWAAILVSLSTVPLAVKIVSFGGIACLVAYQLRKRQLTYDTTFGILAASCLLFLTEPVYLPQTVVLASALLILLTMCLFVPIEIVFLVVVVALSLTYTILLVFTIALRTDPAYTGLFLVLMCIVWLAVARPRRANDV